MRISLKLAAVVVLVVFTASVPTAARFITTAAAGPALQSIGSLAFGPGGVLYAADTKAATIFALDLGAQAAGTTAGTMNVPNIDQKIAALLGTSVAEIAITDLAVHPASHNSYLGVMRGLGTDAQPALVRVDGAGTLTVVAFDAMKFTSATLPNPVAVPATGRSNRAQAVTDMAYFEGRLYITGLSNEEFSSKFWALPYPFASTDNGTSVEIFHGNHGRLETNAPIFTFVPKSVDGKPTLIAGYTCTPLVRFPISDLKPGAKIMGTTIAEFGAGNRPLDMIVYTKAGKEFLLLSNNARGVMKVSTDSFGSAAGITTPVTTTTSGVPYETIAAMTGIEQLDLLDATHSVVIARSATTGLRLEAVILP
jgi:hypothetical protein